MELLFVCAHWHALAKLRLHTDHSLCIFDEVTASIGERLRTFATRTCSAFDTRELRREAEARKRREVKKSMTATSITPTRQQKTFNLQTYKLHVLGDYPTTIRRYGTCDSYSTEPVSTLP